MMKGNWSKPIALWWVICLFGAAVALLMAQVARGDLESIGLLFLVTPWFFAFLRVGIVDAYTGVSK